MYHNVQEPMMDAMSNNQTSAPSPTPTVNNATANQQAGAVGAAMPNPWVHRPERQHRREPHHCLLLLRTHGIP